MLTKTNNIPEKSKTQNFKNSKQYFCLDHWEENSEKFWMDSNVICGWFSVLIFWRPTGPMLTKTKKKKKKKKKNWQKSKISNFTILWTTLVESLPWSMHDFWSESEVHFQKRCRLNFFSLLPYGPMLTKTKNKIVKNQKFKILKNKQKVVCRYEG